MAGKILVHKGFPLSFLSRFHTFTCGNPVTLYYGYQLCFVDIVLHVVVVVVVCTDQRVYSFLILPHRDQDAVLLELVQVRHTQLVGLEGLQLQGARQEPDLTVHMYQGWG